MEAAILIALVLANGFFAMAEISLLTARKARLQRLIDAGDRRARLAAELGAEPTRFLSTIQIGITSVGLLSGIVGESVLAPPLAWRLGALGVPAAAAGYAATGTVVAAITYFTIVVGELLPKRLGQSHAESVARLVAGPIQALALVSKPFVLLLTGSTRFLLRLLSVTDRAGTPVTEDEIHAVLAEGSAAGVIEETEHRMVRNLFRLDDLSIMSLMTPRADTVMLNADATPQDILELLEHSPHSRYPVRGRDEDDIIGVVSARALLLGALRGETPAPAALAKPPAFVPSSLRGTALLQSFRDAGHHMVFVVNEYGTVLGLITPHDLLEAITGVIKGSKPEDEPAVQRKDGSWLFDGQISIHDAFDHLGLYDQAGDKLRDYQTLSGLLISALGRLPKTGDRVSAHGWVFEVVDMDGYRVDRILAVRDESTGPAAHPPDAER